MLPVRCAEGLAIRQAPFRALLDGEIMKALFEQMMQDGSARKIVEAFSRRAGKTLVIATHDQSLADELADYFVYMGDYHGYADRPHVHVNG